jgi:general secretion pathway protein A
MYEAFFNLKMKPFELVPNPEFIYLSRTHKKALHYLNYGISEKAGFVLLTGEIGSGKTTLITDLIKRLDRDVTLAKVFNTKVNSEQLLAMINDDFGLDVKGKDKISLLRDLNDFLIDQHAKRSHVVLVIDEAQNLTPELLEEIRMLSNLESGTAKFMQIVLAGQPELRETLSLPQLRQLRQRISINCDISPLTREEAEEYIFHRLEVAGNRDAVTFAADSMDIIYLHCKGIPRLVNIMCDFLLLTACVEETRTIDAAMVQDIVKDLDFDRLYWGSKEQTRRTGFESPVEQGRKKGLDQSALLNALGVQRKHDDEIRMARRRTDSVREEEGMAGEKGRK